MHPISLILGLAMLCYMGITASSTYQITANSSSLKPEYKLLLILTISHTLLQAIIYALVAKATFEDGSDLYEANGFAKSVSKIKQKVMKKKYLLGAIFIKSSAYLFLFYWLTVKNQHFFDFNETNDIFVVIDNFLLFLEFFLSVDLLYEGILTPLKARLTTNINSRNRNANTCANTIKEIFLFLFFLVANAVIYCSSIMACILYIFFALESKSETPIYSPMSAFVCFLAICLSLKSKLKGIIFKHTVELSLFCLNLMQCWFALRDNSFFLMGNIKLYIIFFIYFTVIHLALASVIVCMAIELYKWYRERSLIRLQSLYNANGVMPPNDENQTLPLSDQVLRSIRTRAYEEEHCKDDSLVICSVCSYGILKGEQVMDLPCLHEFHATCLEDWLKIRGTCPNCRLDIASNMKPAITQDSNQLEILV